MGLMKNPNTWCCIAISLKICHMQWLTSPCASILISSLLHCSDVLYISGIQSEKNGNAKVLICCVHASFWLPFLFNCLQQHITWYYIFRYFSPFAGWFFISDNKYHSNNHMNHSLQQIHEHYKSDYTHNDFGSIMFWQFGLIITQSSSSPDISWAGLCCMWIIQHLTCLGQCSQRTIKLKQKKIL